MELVVSNSIKVSCDICGETMQKQGDTYACYPCKHMLYESELYQYPAQVTIVKEQADALGS
jgi:tRNA(Ile2) C34 agmatinyltransferase TiaS